MARGTGESTPNQKGSLMPDVRTATEILTTLLDLPETRPGCWEAPHVEALRLELTAVLDLLASVTVTP
jgi:hypothetical protein